MLEPQKQTKDAAKSAIEPGKTRKLSEIVEEVMHGQKQQQSKVRFSSGAVIQNANGQAQNSKDAGGTLNANSNGNSLDTSKLPSSINLNNESRQEAPVQKVALPSHRAKSDQ